MAVRHNHQNLDRQLDLFSTPRHETTDSIRPDGRETLARTLPEDGSRLGTQGDSAPDASGSRREDQGRNGDTAHGTDEPGSNGSTGPRPGLGDGAGEIHPASAGALSRPTRSARRSAPAVRNEKN